MSATKDILWDGERLAQFSNVKGPKQASQFRENNRDFFPAKFWEKDTRALSTDPEYDDGAIPGIVPGLGPERVPFWWYFNLRIREAWELNFPLEICVQLISSPISSFLLYARQAWPYQRALMFLGREAWRGRFCGQCGERFVADKPARRFCSATCSSKARRSSRAVSFKKHGEKWRARYQAKISRGKRAKKLMKKS